MIDDYHEAESISGRLTGRIEDKESVTAAGAGLEMNGKWLIEKKAARRRRKRKT